eukprot:6729411-Pyramimonas_sp.AAC.1
MVGIVTTQSIGGFVWQGHLLYHLPSFLRQYRKLSVPRPRVLVQGSRRVLLPCVGGSPVRAFSFLLWPSPISRPVYPGGCLVLVRAGNVSIS